MEKGKTLDKKRRNGYSNDEIWLYDSYNVYSKTQKYPENTYINRVHYLTPLEAMEVVSEKVKYYENVINEKKKHSKS